ncbi:peptidoglycan-binding protein [Cellulomonas sp. 179-A 4D5 NHS]|uniref:peptidoglycan-binding domain-containing protein n=1 Tax=Cellulomonas sp. 179-A 4D5 NHS TaxID=3142378 RepID=UPI0039A2141B
MHQLRRTATALLAVTALLGGGVATATSASAALAQCNNHDIREGNLGVPAYVSGSTIVRSCYLQSGSRNYAVQLLQDALRNCYGQGIAVDGSFGPATRAALVNVQRHHGIAADGSFGPQTRNTINFAGYANGSGALFCLPARTKA